MTEHVFDLNAIQLERSWLTIGSFDGVHLGHQQIINKLVAGARAAGSPAAVVTFFPHPQLVLRGESRPFYLTLPPARARIMGQYGVDVVLTYPFDRDTAGLSPQQFISSLLDHFSFTHLLVGYDFALGKDRAGTSQVLRAIGQELGFEVQEIPPYRVGGALVSSSRIRKLLRSGDVKGAAALLGRDFEISGLVIKGDNRGKSLGFATSNLEVHPELVDIQSGVYACQAVVAGETWPAVTNIGVRPTFGSDLELPRIETHLLDFSRDLYGQQIVLTFAERLRDERKFDQVSDLVAQIGRDVARTRQIFGLG